MRSLSMFIVSFPGHPVRLPCLYPGDDRSDDELLASLEGVKVGAAAGIALGHAAAHRQQIVAGVSLHGRIRRQLTSIVLVVDMEDRSGDGAVMKPGNRTREPVTGRPVHRRGMD